MKFRWCVMSAFVLVACEAPSATRPIAAYDPTILTGGLRYRWTSGTTVRVWTVDASSASPMNLGIAVRAAMSRWNDARQFAEFTLSSASSIGEADVVIYDRESALPVVPASCTFDPRGSAGYTYFCPGTGTPQRTERMLATSGVGSISILIRVDRGRVTTQTAYNAIVAHEFGHVLGIGSHSDVSTDLMFGLPTVEAPSPRDRATLRSVLGALPDLLL